jgi:predicted dehydrogenase
MPYVRLLVLASAFMNNPGRPSIVSRRKENLVETIGVGIVGCGFVGRGAHVPAFNEIDGAQLVAVADPDPNRLKKVASKYRINSSYQAYQSLVADPAVDAVVIAVPTPLHTRVAMAAIEAGKHVLCEMPLAANLDEADDMIKAARKQGVLLMPSLTFRFTPNLVKAKEMIDGGAIGEPSIVHYREFIPARDLARQWPAESWVWNLEESGGPLFTLSVWSIDLVRWLLGSEVTEVHSAVKYTRLEKFGGTLGYDACATLCLASGVVGCLQYSGSIANSAAASALEVVGNSTCMLSASGNDSLTLYADAPARTEWKLKEPGPRSWGHLQQDEHFVQCIRETKEPVISPEDGRRAMEIALQIAKAR